ncbi:MAG: zinc-dependent metalloprotease family protein [Bacteroidota bacterium]
MRKICTLVGLVAFVLTSMTGNAQQAGKAKNLNRAAIGKMPAADHSNKAPDVWTKVPESAAPSRSLMRIQPVHYAVYTLNEAALKPLMFNLSTAPEEGIIISLPMADGSSKDFKVWAAPMLQGRLAERYADIRTFTGVAVNDQRITAKLDFTVFGFHAVVFESGNTCLIDPYDIYHDGYYVVHYKRDERRAYGSHMKCEVEDNNAVAGKTPMTFTQSRLPKMTPLKTGARPKQALRLVDGWRTRTYDIAVSANSFYCQAATGLPSPTIAQCLSVITTTMNRVNGVYNREFSVQMNFVANEDTLIWPTATGSINGSDPFFADNSNASNCLTINQTVVTARIGTANYDIGHIFTTGAGGLASLGIVCNNSFKAQGVTGSSMPVGDAYDIDYVAHEVGHQFGSSHTFNNNTDGSCSGNASATHAYEPGSGATIMDYAGICSPDNLQPHSDPYFSASSLQQIDTLLKGAENTCATTALSGNKPAYVAPFTATYNIPYKTPFELTGPVAIDSVADTATTYCWYQWNLGATGASGDNGKRLNQTFITGPIFRSFQPVYTPYRCFPKTSMVLAGVLSDAGIDGAEGEKVPDTARYLTFKMAVRAIITGNGALTVNDDTIHINASATGVANAHRGFRVTSQGTTGIVYTGGTTQTVTWNVVGTNAAPVSAATVDIYMSTDGGNTWPYTIGNFPNTGTASVTIPNPGSSTAAARIKVKGGGNIFFNVNSNNFTVNPGSVTAPITGTFTVCAGATTTLADATTGGTWSSSTPAVATINAAGVVTGVSGGTTTISYAATSGTVTAIVTVNTTPAPGSITGTASICMGQTSTLANTTTGGTWSSTNLTVATINSSGVVSGLTAGTSTISYVVTNGCGTGGATRVVTVSAPTVVAPITGTLSRCVGQTTTLSDITAGGTWSSSNTAIATITAGGVVSGVSAGTSIISYSVTNAGGCVSSATATATINALPSGTVIPSGTVTICTGGMATLTASSGTGYTYQWQIGGSPISGATNATYAATAAGNYNVVVTSAAGCVTTSATVTVNISTGFTVVPSVNITSSAGTVLCGSTSLVTFTANPVNGGSAPAYQWSVNGVVSGTGVTYSYIPANGDIVAVQMTSNAPCASPTIVNSSVTMTVNTPAIPTVTVVPSPNDTVCTGDPVTYNASITFGGTSPTFLWTENGVNVATGSSYTTTSPTDGDVIVCYLTSNHACVATTTATSAPFTIRVMAPVANTVTVTASTTSFAAGTMVTLVAIAPSAGTYQWYINGSPVAGATSAVFSTNSLNDGDVVNCAVTAGYVCALPRVVISGGISMHVSLGISETILSSFNIVPNPNNGTFAITGELCITADDKVNLTITNMLGQVIYTDAVTARNGNVNARVSLDASVANGMYLVKVTSGDEHVVFHMLLRR